MRAGPRRRARRLALQALYQWALTGHSPAEIESQFLEDRVCHPEALDLELFRSLLRETVEGVEDIDGRLRPLLDRAPERLDPVERAILRLAACELLHHPEVPHRVVINEAVDLAREFGAEQSHRFVNAVLDRLAREVRPNL